MPIVPVTNQVTINDIVIEYCINLTRNEITMTMPDGSKEVVTIFHTGQFHYAEDGYTLYINRDPCKIIRCIKGKRFEAKDSDGITIYTALEEATQHRIKALMDHWMREGDGYWVTHIQRTLCKGCDKDRYNHKGLQETPEDTKVTTDQCWGLTPTNIWFDEHNQKWRCQTGHWQYQVCNVCAKRSPTAEMYYKGDQYICADCMADLKKVS